MTPSEANGFMRRWLKQEVDQHDAHATRLELLIGAGLDVTFQRLWEAEVEYHRNAAQRCREAIHHFEVEP
jgi:hypothetical protein